MNWEDDWVLCGSDPLQAKVVAKCKGLHPQYMHQLQGTPSSCLLQFFKSAVGCVQNCQHGNEEYCQQPQPAIGVEACWRSTRFCGGIDWRIDWYQRDWLPWLIGASCFCDNWWTSKMHLRGSGYWCIEWGLRSIGAMEINFWLRVEYGPPSGGVPEYHQQEQEQKLKQKLLPSIKNRFFYSDRRI